MGRILAALAVTIFSYSSFASTIIYVDADATGADDGTSWENAYCFLQDGLADANSAEKPVEILVAEGIYTPDSNSNYPNGTGDREASFYLINEVTLKGGFAGCDQPEPNARDYRTYETILSGDLDANDADINEPSDLLNHQSRADNSYHIVKVIDINETAIDGFIITGGNANDYEVTFLLTITGNCNGAGIFIETSGQTFPEPSKKTVIENCTFENNSSFLEGGGICSWDMKLKLSNCNFINNSSCAGGAISSLNYYSHSYDYFKGGLDINDCTFTSNYAIERFVEYTPSITIHIYGYGGGVADNRAPSNYTNCRFSGNFATSNGGGMYRRDCLTASPKIINCIFSNNYTEGSGGAITNYCSKPEICNCTIAKNTAGNYGGGVFNEKETSSGGMPSCCLDPPNPKFTNCIFWDNADSTGENELSQIRGGNPVINYTCLYGWSGALGGIGNIGNDPLFADADANDFHLQSQAGRWDANSESWVTDSNTSPCIDAGDPNSDWTAELWPHGKRINTGAYGGTAEASMSLSDAGNIADLDKDDDVDYNDLKLFTDKWPAEQLLLAEDLDRNGRINFKDCAIFANEWFNEHIGEPGITYQISGCGMSDLAGGLEQTRFTVTVEGNYIHFEDMMTANCCTEEFEILMVVDDGQITIYEIECAGAICLCICDYPVRAKLGPFEAGIYTLAVYEDWGGFIGSTTVIIE